MNTIRMARIYDYFYNTALASLDELKRVKELYRDGAISYRRAWKIMDALIRQIRWRCAVCYGCSNITKHQTLAYQVEKESMQITAWMAM